MSEWLTKLDNFATHPGQVLYGKTNASTNSGLGFSRCQMPVPSL